jgi:hypothetical protein
MRSNAHYPYLYRSPTVSSIYNGKHGAQRVELCDLNIRRVQIFVAVAQE